MEHCFVCKRPVSGSTYMNIYRLGKEGIVIPSGMKDKDVICNDCFLKEKSVYKQPAMYVNPNVRGLEIHDKALTPEEVKQLFEQAKARGPPKLDDNKPHFISHKDEKDGYLWIDGKKVKKHDPHESK